MFLIPGALLLRAFNKLNDDEYLIGMCGLGLFELFMEILLIGAAVS